MVMELLISLGSVKSIVSGMIKTKWGKSPKK